MANPPLMTQRLTDAFDMAGDVQNGDPIKGTDLPYLLHLLDVCSIALRHGADEDLAIAALLHDVVEDGRGAPKLDWWARKIGYIDHPRAAPEDVALVSGADKLSNVRSILAGYAVQGDTFFANFRISP